MSKIFIDLISELIVSVPEDRHTDLAKSSDIRGVYLFILVVNTKLGAKERLISDSSRIPLRAVPYSMENHFYHIK